LLILSRKLDESVFIGEKIKVSVVEVKGGHVKLGIEAPDHVLVYRGEIFEKILEENRNAASAEIHDLDAITQLLAGRRKRKTNQREGQSSV